SEGQALASGCPASISSPFTMVSLSCVALLYKIPIIRYFRRDGPCLPLCLDPGPSFGSPKATNGHENLAPSGLYDPRDLGTHPGSPGICRRLFTSFNFRGTSGAARN